MHIMQAIERQSILNRQFCLSGVAAAVWCALDCLTDRGGGAVCLPRRRGAHARHHHRRLG